MAVNEIDLVKGVLRQRSVVDAYPALERAALRTIGQLLFGAPFHSASALVQVELKTLSNWAERCLGLPVDPLTRLVWMLSRKARRARERLFAALTELTEGARGREDSIVGSLVTEERLDDKELLNHLCTLLLAGHETTAAASAWSLLLLAADKETYEAVSTEGRSSDSGRELPVTTAVVKESMRLYPPVWAITRRARQSSVIGGFRFRKSSSVLINVFGIHRDPGLWERPAIFLPRRFAAGTAGPEYYLPFGAGMRKCIGLHAGLANACALVAKFSAYLEPCAGNVEMEAGLTLRPKGPVLMRALTSPPPC
jgi:cytochrome P450